MNRLVAMYSNRKDIKTGILYINADIHAIKAPVTALISKRNI